MGTRECKPQTGNAVARIPGIRDQEKANGTPVSIRADGGRRKTDVTEVSMYEDDGWVERLRPEHAEREAAIAELRAILLRGLNKSLNHRYGKPFFAEDVVQDALIRILDSLDQFQGKSRFITWAMTIAIRIGISSLRRKYHEDMSLEAFSGDDGFRIEVATSVPPVDDDSDKVKLLQTLQRLIDDALTTKQRLVVRAFLAGYSTDGIAQQTGTNRNAIYKLMHDARVKLKTGIASAGFSADDVATALAEGIRT